MRDFDNQDWLRMLPDVATEILGDPTSVFGDEYRWGRRGSLIINPQTGWYDFDKKVGGFSVKKMVAHLMGLTIQDAVTWLKSKHFIRGGVSPAITFKRPPAEAKPFDPGKRETGSMLYAKALPIPHDHEHPCWRWAKRRNLLVDDTTFPDDIRFFNRKDATVMVVPMYTVSDAIESYHMIAINENGEKAKAFNGLDKITYGKSEHCTFYRIKRDGTDRVYVCEGVADAIAIASRCHDGSVITPITTLNKIKNDDKLVEMLAGREVMIYSDNDQPGIDAGIALGSLLHEAGGKGQMITEYFGVDGATDPAHAAELLLKDDTQTEMFPDEPVDEPETQEPVAQDESTNQSDQGKLTLTFDEVSQMYQTGRTEIDQTIREIVADIRSGKYADEEKRAGLTHRGHDPQN